MIYNLELYFLVFLSYAILGWILEVIDKSFEFKRFINRGFLIGPYCPIYGVGGLLATLLLQKYSNDIVALFLFGVIIFSILEYYTSLIMEKIFHARWWDYSNNKFNINGRISLNTMIPFGLLGVVVIKFINPILFGFLEGLNPIVFDMIFITTFVFFIIDLCFSFNILNGVGKQNKLAEKDNTEEIKKIVSNKIMGLGWAYRRLINAFPNLRIITKETKEMIGEKIKKYNQKQKIIKEKADKKLANFQSKYDQKKSKIIDKYNKKLHEAEDKKGD